MDRGAWQAIVHGVARVGHNLATKPTNQFLNHHHDKGEAGGRGSPTSTSQPWGKAIGDSFLVDQKDKKSRTFKGGGWALPGPHVSFLKLGDLPDHA